MLVNIDVEGLGNRRTEDTNILTTGEIQCGINNAGKSTQAKFVKVRVLSVLRLNQRYAS
jgi:hypothetical protein